jgi:hypothetical protein
LKIRLARIIPTVGLPGTIDAREALAVFWADCRLWRELSQIDGNDGLRPPVIEVFCTEGLAFRVDGAAAPTKCDRCGWPMLRDEALDAPVLVSDGSRMGGDWRGRRCAADPAHTSMEPFD